MAQAPAKTLGVLVDGEDRCDRVMVDVPPERSYAIGVLDGLITEITVLTMPRAFARFDLPATVEP